MPIWTNDSWTEQATDIGKDTYDVCVFVSTNAFEAGEKMQGGMSINISSMGEALPRHSTPRAWCGRFSEESATPPTPKTSERLNQKDLTNFQMFDSFMPCVLRGSFLMLILLSLYNYKHKTSSANWLIFEYLSNMPMDVQRK